MNKETSLCNRPITETTDEQNIENGWLWGNPDPTDSTQPLYLRLREQWRRRRRRSKRTAVELSHLGWRRHFPGYKLQSLQLTVHHSPFDCDPFWGGWGARPAGCQVSWFIHVFSLLNGNAVTHCAGLGRRSNFLVRQSKRPRCSFEPCLNCPTSSEKECKYCQVGKTV